MDVSLSAVQNYESGKIPNGEILIRLSRALACSTDWLLMGTGGQSTDQVVRLQVAPEQTPAQTSIYNDMGRKPLSIGDLLAKTATVLESDTVYRDALHSNIEAFYASVMLEQKIKTMEATITSRLDAIEAENAQLRQELEQSRAESAVRNTG